jgi:hypothetical protein
VVLKVVVTSPIELTVGAPFGVEVTVKINDDSNTPSDTVMVIVVFPEPPTTGVTSSEREPPVPVTTRPVVATINEFDDVTVTTRSFTFCNVSLIVNGTVTDVLLNGADRSTVVEIDGAVFEFVIVTTVDTFVPIVAPTAPDRFTLNVSLDS